MSAVIFNVLCAVDTKFVAVYVDKRSVCQPGKQLFDCGFGCKIIITVGFISVGIGKSVNSYIAFIVVPIILEPHIFVDNEFHFSYQRCVFFRGNRKGFFLRSGSGRYNESESFRAFVKVDFELRRKHVVFVAAVIRRKVFLIDKYIRRIADCDSQYTAVQSDIRRRAVQFAESRAAGGFVVRDGISRLCSVKVKRTGSRACIRERRNVKFTVYRGVPCSLQRVYDRPFHVVSFDYGVIGIFVSEFYGNGISSQRRTFYVAFISVDRYAVGKVFGVNVDCNFLPGINTLYVSPCKFGGVYSLRRYGYIGGQGLIVVISERYDALRIISARVYGFGNDFAFGGSSDVVSPYDGRTLRKVRDHGYFSRSVVSSGYVFRGNVGEITVFNGNRQHRLHAESVYGYGIRSRRIEFSKIFGGKHSRR